MPENLAYQIWEQEEYRSELLNGNIVLMSPRPKTNHNRVARNIGHAFLSCLKGKKCEPFNDGVDVYLTEKDRVIPDAIIVCDPDKIREDGVHGAPDLIVEVLSPRTQKWDRGYKKELYERCGVREYWIVNPQDRAVEVYLRRNDKFVLDNVYQIFPAYEALAPEEKEIYRDIVPVSLYDDFSIPLEDIFYNVQ